MTFIIRFGVIALLCSLLFSQPVRGCSQATQDDIATTNKDLVKLKIKYARCTGEDSNEERSACWKDFKLSNDDQILYEELDARYESFFVLCSWDSLLYNLGNYRLAFGRSCRSFDSFSRIKTKGRYAQLSQIMADASLQCARDTAGTSTGQLKLQNAHEYFRSTLADAPRATSIQRQRLGRLLGTWRDVFAVPAENQDATSVAQAIHSYSYVWPNWESFLSKLRVHLSSWASRLYPNQADKSVTAFQYELSAQKLSP